MKTITTLKTEFIYGEEEASIERHLFKNNKDLKLDSIRSLAKVEDVFYLIKPYHEDRFPYLLFSSEFKLLDVKIRITEERVFNLPVFKYEEEIYCLSDNYILKYDNNTFEKLTKKFKCTALYDNYIYLLKNDNLYITNSMDLSKLGRIVHSNPYSKFIYLWYRQRELYKDKLKPVWRTYDTKYKLYNTGLTYKVDNNYNLIDSKSIIEFIDGDPFLLKSCRLITGAVITLQ